MEVGSSSESGSACWAERVVWLLWIGPSRRSGPSARTGASAEHRPSSPGSRGIQNRCWRGEAHGMTPAIQYYCRSRNETSISLLGTWDLLEWRAAAALTCVQCRRPPLCRICSLWFSSSRALDLRSQCSGLPVPTGPIVIKQLGKSTQSEMGAVYRIPFPILGFGRCMGSTMFQ